VTALPKRAMRQDSDHPRRAAVPVRQGREAATVLVHDHNPLPWAATSLRLHHHQVVASTARQARRRGPHQGRRYDDELGNLKGGARSSA